MTTENSADAVLPPFYSESDQPYYDEPARGPRETTPLIRKPDDEEVARRAERTLKTHLIYLPITIALVALLTTLIYRNIFVDPLSDRSREDVRQRWDAEKQQHEKDVSEWQEEIQGYRDQELDLLDRLATIRTNIGEQEERNEDLRRDALQWEGRARRAEKEESEALDRKNAYERGLREEQEERAKMRLYWDDLVADEQCLGHDRIHYRALLANLQDTIHPIDACKATSITINGVHYATPEQCEDIGNSTVYGHWMVTNEAKCTSYWDHFKDKGCTAPGSRIRRFEAPLAGTHDGQDQEQLCHTTPATILGQTFSGPSSCTHWVLYGFWGIWDVPDDSCA